jgi:hypothetical protein
MAHGGFQFERDPSVPPPGYGTILFRLAYGQVASALLGFSLLMLMTNLIGAGFFVGPLQNLHDIWVQIVRPAIGIPLQSPVDLLDDRYRFQISTPVVDYVAVGLAVILWDARSGFSLPRGFDEIVGGVLLPLFFWPVLLFIILPSSRLYMGTKWGTIEIGWTLWAPPLIYCALWFVANFFV